MVDVGISEVGEGLREGLGAGTGKPDADDLHGAGWVPGAWWRVVGKAIEVFDERPDGTA